MISVAEDRLEVRFEKFDLESYDLFLKTKKLPEHSLVFDPVREVYTLSTPARFAHILGVAGIARERDLQPMPLGMFDYQGDIATMALKAKRFAAWCDCGLGKTYIGLEFARQAARMTGRRGVIFTLRDLIGQWIELAAEYYPEGRKQKAEGGNVKLTVLRTRAELIDFCNGPADGAIGITNYEKFVVRSVEKNAGIIRELNKLGFIVVDESSMLKSGGGVIKWNLVKSARGIEYKLSLTATPAPNDLMEYASQAGFLEKLISETDILWTYFKKNKHGEWEVKPHALEPFYRFMASWSIYLRSPKRYGWKDNQKDIPEPLYIEHRIPVTADQSTWKARVLAESKRSQTPAEFLDAKEREVGLGVVERSKLAQIAKGFIYQATDSGRKARRIISRKPAAVAQIAEAEHAAGRQVLIWTAFDEETVILAELLPDAAVLTGKLDPKERRRIIAAFKRGDIRILITRADLLGFGQNFQMAEAMIFSAFTDSYEEFYQAIRRAYRYGQTQRVRIHIPWVDELEGAIKANLMRKAGNFERDAAKQEECYIFARAGLLKGAA